MTPPTRAASSCNARSAGFTLGTCTLTLPSMSSISRMACGDSGAGSATPGTPAIAAGGSAGGASVATVFGGTAAASGAAKACGGDGASFSAARPQPPRMSATEAESATPKPGIRWRIAETTRRGRGSYRRAFALQPAGVVDLHLVVLGEVGLRGVGAARATQQVVAGVVPITLRGRLPVEGADAALVGHVEQHVVDLGLHRAVFGGEELDGREFAGQAGERARPTRFGGGRVVR